MAIHESIETILLKRNRKAWRKDFGPKKFDSMLSESETEDKQRALRSGSYKPGDDAPKVSTQSDTVIQQKPDNSFYTDEVNSGTIRKSGHATNAGSDPYAIQEPRQVPYTNPYDIPQGNNPNDYVYKSTQQAPTNDPHGKTWTDEQKTRKQLNDLKIEKDNLEASFVGMPTTEVVVKLGAFDDTIKKLSAELGVGDSVANAPLGQGFVDDVVDREQEIADQSTKPSVPTMTTPLPWYEQPDEPTSSAPKPEPADTEVPEYELYGSAKPQLTLAEQIQQNALDKPFGQLGALTPDWEKPQDDNAGGGYVNLYDDIPTMEDIEAAYQAAQAANGSNGVGAEEAEERAEAARINYAEDLWLQFHNSESIAKQDAFLESRGFSLGREGFYEIWSVATNMLGKEEFEQFREELKPESMATFTSPEGERGSERPSMSGNYGLIGVNGEDINIIPWDSKYKQYPYEVVDSYKGKVVNLNEARLLLDLDLEYTTKPGGPLVQLLQLAHQVMSAHDGIYVTIDVIDVDGQKGAVIKYNDSGWDSLLKRTGDTIYNFDTGTEITLDVRHDESEFGYIYVEDGKTLISPVFYQGDKYIAISYSESATDFSGKVVDLTHELKTPFQLSKDAVLLIEEAIKDAGLSIDLPY